jgi:transposase InsO family protein
LETLSKANQLGIIILAFQLLRGVKFPLPRLVRGVARLLGVSAKAGYQAARRISERLRSSEEPESSETPRRELLRLRLRNQVLTYERDHPEVRFAEHHRHLPREARSLCVRLLRDFREELSESDIAAEIGVSLSSLRRWDEEANEHLEFPEKPERRGLQRRASAEDVERVLKLHGDLKESMSLEEFSAHFRASYPDQPLDRRTITRILQRHELREIETRSTSEPYHPPFEVYFPGAQAAIDATKCEVVFQSDPERPVTLTQEVAIDIASAAILGEALRKEEDAAGVERVLVLAREECQSILAVLSDNGSANRAHKVEEFLSHSGAISQVFSFPYHPQTNGYVEGLFGQFWRIVERIEIDDTSRETLAASIVVVVWRIFIYFYNHSPRKRLDGLSPMEYLRRYAALPEEVEAAKKALRRQRERSRALREKHPRLGDPRFRSEVEHLLKLHRFEVLLDRALKALQPYDLRVIESSSNAFFLQSQRDGFDERKRTFAYFLGIVRNKQKELDEARLRARFDAEMARKDRQELEEHRRRLESEKAQEEEDLKSQPERVILSYSRLLLSGKLQLMRRTWLEGLRGALRALHSLGRGTQRILEQLAMTIQGWGKYSEELKRQMVSLLYEEDKALERLMAENRGLG